MKAFNLLLLLGAGAAIFAVAPMATTQSPQSGVGHHQSSLVAANDAPSGARLNAGASRLN